MVLKEQRQKETVDRDTLREYRKERKKRAGYFSSDSRDRGKKRQKG